jgi:RNA polymerase sigma-70 factor (ECF subfamily)
LYDGARLAHESSVIFSDVEKRLIGPSHNAAEAQSSGPDFAALIGKVAEGDQQALATLYDGTSKLVFGLVLRILGDRSVAEEVLFDVYTQVWRQAARYDPSRGGPLGWITTIARSRAIDRLRSDKPLQQEDELSDTTASRETSAASPETNAALAEMREIVRAALAHLSPEQREIIELAYYSGMTQTEIAAHLSLPLGTVKTRTRLAMMKLRDALKPIMERPL